MENNLTKQESHDNVLLLALGGYVIMTNIILEFIDSDIFKVLNFVVVFATLFTFAWFKLILLDEYVHSFWLRRRLRKGFRCIYGYGIDEYFVLARLIFLTGTLVLTIIILNGVDIVSGVFSPWSVVIEGCISSVFICIYCVQLSKYDSAFGFKETIVPLVSSCIGLLMTSMLIYHCVLLSVLLLFFAYGFIVCAKEILSIVKTLGWGDYAIVRVGDALFDSGNQQFYLLFFSKSKVTMVLRENDCLRFRQVDYIESIGKIPKVSDRVDGWQDFTPLWQRVIEWFMGLRIFR